MKKLLFAALVLICAAQVNAIPWVRNATSSLSSEDSLTLIFHLPDSVAQPHAHLDTTHILVFGPGGDSIAAKVIVGVADSANFGKITKRRTGSLVTDTAYAFTFQVSNLDGAGRAGVYPIQIMSVSHNADSSKWYRFAKDYYMQVIGVRPSVFAAASSIDSTKIYQASYQANKQWAIDSTIDAPAFISMLLDTVLDRGVQLWGTAVWDSLARIMEAGSWGALAADNNVAGTMGARLNWAGDPANYPTVKQQAEAVWDSTGSKKVIYGTQVFNNTGTWTGPINGTVSEVTSVTLVDDVTNQAAEHIAAVVRDSGNAPTANWDSTGGGGSSRAVTPGNSNEILNPYFSLDTGSAWVVTSTPYSLPSQITGWALTYYAFGSGVDDSIIVADSARWQSFDAPEYRIGGGKILQLIGNRTHTGTVRDSVVLTSNAFKIFPGYYKFGIRSKVPGSAGLIPLLQFDSVSVQIRNLNNVVIAENVIGQSNVFWSWAAQYISSDTLSVRLAIRGSYTRNSGELAKILQVSQAFCQPLGPNPWALDAATARIRPGSIGDSLQKPQQIAISVDTAAIAAGIMGRTVSSAAGSATLAGFVYRLDSLIKAVKDTISDGVNGMLVNVQAINGDSSAAVGLSYIVDTSETGKGKLILQQVAVGPPVSANSAFAITGNGLPALNINQNSAGSPAIYVGAPDAGGYAIEAEGGSGGMKLEGTGTGAPGLRVNGEGTSADVVGQFPVDADITLGDVNISCQGDGIWELSVYAQDTSGTDEYVYNVVVSITALGSSVPDATWSTQVGAPATFMLNDGQYEIRSRRAGYRFQTDTVTISGSDASLTLQGYNTSSTSLSTVWGFLNDHRGFPITEASVRFFVNKPQKNICDTSITIMASKYEVEPDALGYFEIPLLKSSCMNNEEWKVEVWVGTTRYKETSIRIPADSSTFKLAW